MPDIPTVAADDFSRRFSMRGGNLMWFLGAGASAAGGIPTAWDMIWDFKQRLYVSQTRTSPKAVSDISNPFIQQEIQSHINNTNIYPPPGSPEEYARLFEAVFPNENDRRTYLDGKITGAKPSYAHIALATLMKADKARLIWTTNFDPLIADGCAKVYGGTGSLSTIILESASMLPDTMNNGRWPAEIKLHGDFRSRNLKNTPDELRQQDATLRGALEEACNRWGLVVAGYSGRDDSIMDTLEGALDKSTPFPAGLFWLNRGDGEPLPRVSNLLKKAATKNVDGGLVAIESFDEALRDLIRLIDDLDMTALDNFAASRRIWTPAPSPKGERGFPVIRLNALELTNVPTVCRRISCKIGGHAEVIKAVEEASTDVLATRSKAGVLAFGSDLDLRTTFEQFSISDFDLHTIEIRRLRYDSQERGLLGHALSRAISREKGMSLRRRRGKDLLAPLNPSSSDFAILKQIVGTLSGSVPGHPNLEWTEGVALRLDWADDRLWLLFEPRVIFSNMTEDNRFAANDFARERTVRRYNRVLNDLMSFWTLLLASGGNEFRALNVTTGVDAAFKLDPHTAFSGRASR